MEISVNYLSSLLLEQAGLEQTSYQRFLSELQESYPIMTTAGVRCEDGSWITVEEMQAREDEGLELYEQLQYNYLLGGEDRIDAWFRLSEQE